MQSVGDLDVKLEGEYLNFFNQLKDMDRKGSIILKDLKELAQTPSSIGGREIEAHDYALRKTGEGSEIREWIRIAIDGKK